MESVLKSFYVNVGHNHTNWWPHGNSFGLFKELLLEQEIDVVQEESQKLYYVIGWHDGSIWEFCILFQPILKNI